MAEAGTSYSHHATDPLDAEIQTNAAAGQDVMETRPFQVQERGQSLWHEFEENRNDEIGNGDGLGVGEVVV